MTQIRTRARVGPDGNITVPIGMADAGAEVEVVVTPMKPQISDEEYRAMVMRTAGSIPDLERPPQWTYAKRDPLD